MSKVAGTKIDNEPLETRDCSGNKTPSHFYLFVYTRDDLIICGVYGLDRCAEIVNV